MLYMYAYCFLYREKLKREQQGEEIVLLMSGKDGEISSLRKVLLDTIHVHVRTALNLLMFVVFLQSIEASIQKETNVSSQ